MRVPVSLIVVPGLVVAALAWGTIESKLASQDPEFDDRIKMAGNSVYNSADWFIHGASQFAGVSLEGDGVVYRPPDNASGSIRNQLIRQYVAEDGTATARFRIIVSNLDQVGFLAGVYEQESDPLTNDPIGAYFYNDASGADSKKVDLIVREDSENETIENNKFTVANDENIDIILDYNGSASPATVKFWWKPESALGWNSQTISTDVPDGFTKLHFSVVAFTDEENGTEATLTLQVWFLDAPTGEAQDP